MDGDIRPLHSSTAICRSFRTKANGLAEIAVERHQYAALVSTVLIEALVFGTAQMLLGDRHDVVTVGLQQRLTKQAEIARRV